MKNQELHELYSRPVVVMRKNSQGMDQAISRLQEAYGDVITDGLLVLIFGLRHIKPLDRRIEVGAEIGQTILDSVASGARSGVAVRAALSRHAENHAMKDNVFDWLDANFSSRKITMEAAALEIAGKLVPAKYSTVRSWITEWKKIRSASTT